MVTALDQVSELQPGLEPGVKPGVRFARYSADRERSLLVQGGKLGILALVGPRRSARERLGSWY